MKYHMMSTPSGEGCLQTSLSLADVISSSNDSDVALLSENKIIQISRGQCPHEQYRWWSTLS